MTNGHIGLLGGGVIGGGWAARFLLNGHDVVMYDPDTDAPRKVGEFWSAVVLDFAEVPAHMFTAMFACARTAGWSAHILEQKRTGRLIRPSAVYTGPPSRPPSDVTGDPG